MTHGWGRVKPNDVPWLLLGIVLWAFMGLGAFRRFNDWRHPQRYVRVVPSPQQAVARAAEIRMRGDSLSRQADSIQEAADSIYQFAALVQGDTIPCGRLATDSVSVTDTSKLDGFGRMRWYSCYVRPENDR